MSIAVDATDIQRRIVTVHETLPVTGGGDLVLLYPQWTPGDHRPDAPIDRLAGLKITAGGVPVPWARDTVDIYAFHVRPRADAKTVQLEFQYLSPVRDAVGPIEMSANMAVLEWTSLVIYPAGYFVRQIPVDASLTLPANWSFANGLDRAETRGATTTFRRAPLETLVDSPIFAGANAKVIDLTAVAGGPPVRLNIFADRPENLEIKPEQIAQHRRLVEQAVKLYGSQHYDHYDFLLTLSDTIEQLGLEHHRSSEDGYPSDHFTTWAKDVADRDLLAHEYTHSWNGKFRRPADLWTETYNTPMRDSLLWVYEGQTQYWGDVLTARSGMRSKEETLETLAIVVAARGLNQAGRRNWQPLQDTTNNEIITERRPQSWYSRGGSLDYYYEGQMIWLDVDTLIREKSAGKHSLDDFARSFFGIDNGSFTPVTYRFEDVVAALNAVQPYDWAGFLRARLDGTGGQGPLEGLARGGYKLAFDETAGSVYAAREASRKVTDLGFSIGVSIGKEGVLTDVVWDGPAFKAGLTPGVKLIAVNGTAFDPDILKAAITAAKAPGAPLELIVQDQTQFRVVKIDWRGGLRYPHLVRDPARPARLDNILAPRP